MLTTSTYDAANQQLTGITNSDVTTFTYDANGNQTIENANGALTTYTWDEENRISGVEGTGTESFTYAGDGQRRGKTTSGGDINYLWDTDNVLEELDGSDSLIAHYTDFPGYWGGLSSLMLPSSSPSPQMAGMGAFNAVQFNQAAFNQSGGAEDSGSFYYLFDLQSSNRLLLDASANIENKYLYKAFGKKVLSTGSVRNPFQFQGEVGPYFDANNRTWMRARIYNPIPGRWSLPDPSGFTGGDWNLYRFVENEPVNGVDPSGLVNRTGISAGWVRNDSKYSIEALIDTGEKKNRIVWRFPIPPGYENNPETADLDYVRNYGDPSIPWYHLKPWVLFGEADFYSDCRGNTSVYASGARPVYARPPASNWRKKLDNKLGKFAMEEWIDPASGLPFHMVGSPPSPVIILTAQQAIQKGFIKRIPKNHLM